MSGTIDHARSAFRRGTLPASSAENWLTPSSSRISAQPHCALASWNHFVPFVRASHPRSSPKRRMEGRGEADALDDMEQRVAIHVAVSCCAGLGAGAWAGCIRNVIGKQAIRTAVRAHGAHSPLDKAYEPNHTARDISTHRVGLSPRPPAGAGGCCFALDGACAAIPRGRSWHRCFMRSDQLVLVASRLHRVERLLALDHDYRPRIIETHHVKPSSRLPVFAQTAALLMLAPQRRRPRPYMRSSAKYTVISFPS
ncbi:hypothetical protein R3P38DRAFT_3177710 [Favolaschia claudopus]|uniref:Uncharacterized protein n=1 Tax=Favolaschia claudopus TaxID=2862362 RepID=A0AAW0CXN0_9AGAR